VNLTNATGGSLRKKQGVSTILDYVAAALLNTPSARRRPQGSLVAPLNDATVDEALHDLTLAGSRAACFRIGAALNEVV
jgi:hypothetical protein